MKRKKNEKKGAGGSEEKGLNTGRYKKGGGENKI